MCIKAVCSVRTNQAPKMFPDKNMDRQHIQKKPWNVEETFSNLCRDAVLLYFLLKCLQGMWALPRSARMGEMGQHVRLPAWDGRHRTCVLISPQYAALTHHCRGWTRRSFNQGSFVSPKKRGRVWEEMEEETRRGLGKWMCQRPMLVSQGCHGAECDLWLVLEMDLEFSFQAAN